MDADLRSDFADIRIVDLDLTKTSGSRVHDSLRVMYLRLDREPDNEWRRLFFEERTSRIVARRRGFWIEDGYISFDTAADEVESVHLPDIRKSLSHANLEYRKWYRQRQAQHAATLVGRQDERTEMLALQARVRLTIGSPGAADETRRTEMASPEMATATVAQPPSLAEREAATFAEFEMRRATLKYRIRLAMAAGPKENARGDD